MKKFTLTLWLMLAITLLLWVMSKSSFGVILVDPLRSFTQAFALIGAVGYFVSFILSSRFPFFEKELPLDKSYKLHRIIGTVAGSGILLHVATLITNLLPSPKALSLYLLPGNTLSYTVGIFAFYLLFLMLITTIYMKLPYHIWKVIHKITSYSVIFASLHLLLIPSDISTFLPLRIWMLGITLLGLIAWVYRQFFYSIVAYNHNYSVSDVTNLEGVNVITMVAQDDSLPLEPGQFAFFKVYNAESGIKSESHPFTVLSSTQNTIMIAAKDLGDYTSSLSQLKKGDLLKVAGPHGTFGKEILEGKRPQIWIAGGIGVTPFFNLISYYSSNKFQKNISLYYATSQQDKLFHPLLLGYSNNVGINYSYHCSDSSERLSPDTVLQGLKSKASDYDYFLCGPRGLLLSFMTTLEAAGVPSSQIFTEDFDFKTLDI